MPQTWFINGRHMNREQMLAWRAKQNTPKEVPVEIEPFSADETVLVPNPVASEGGDASIGKDESIEAFDVSASDQEELAEFEQMKKQRAWVKPELKARYAELKTKLNA